MSDYTDFRSGDRVKVIDGTFAGMQGIVVSRAKANALCETVGGQRPSLTAVPGMVHVMLTIFNRTVPVTLLTWQIEKVSRRSSSKRSTVKSQWLSDGSQAMCGNVAARPASSVRVPTLTT
jgi:ribosomal protein L24